MDRPSSRTYSSAGACSAPRSAGRPRTVRSRPRLLAGLRVGPCARPLDVVLVGRRARQQLRGEAGEEAEPQLPVERLRHHQQFGRVPVGAHQRAQRRARLARGGQRHEAPAAARPDARCRTVAAGSARPAATASARASVCISVIGRRRPRRRSASARSAAARRRAATAGSAGSPASPWARRPAPLRRWSARPVRRARERPSASTGPPRGPVAAVEGQLAGGQALGRVRGGHRLDRGGQLLAAG